MAKLKNSSVDNEVLIDELVEFVIETSEVPISFWSVAALLESRGLRDVDAIEKYEHTNIFNLAETVYEKTKLELKNNFKSKLTKMKAELFLETVKRFFILYGKGIFFALPMAGQLFAILYFRYSLWAWMDFSIMQASIVAIATIFSFILTGGLAQVIGREGIFYIGQKNPYLMNKVCLRLIGLGLLIAMSFSALVFLSNFIFSFFNVDQYVTFFIYYNLLTLLWLIFSVLFMLEDNIGIFLSTVVGTLGVHLVMISKYENIYLAHSLGLIIASAVAYLFYYIRYRRLIKKMDEKLYLSNLPRQSVLVHIVEPFMVFGTLYFSFLFIDRIIGWSAGVYKKPLLIWFRTSYELGMDWALMSLLLTSAVLTYTVHQFNMRLIPLQQSVVVFDFKKFNSYFSKFFKRQLVLISGSSVVSVLLVYFLAIWVKNNVQYLEVEEFFSNPITYFTFWVSALSYSFLIMAQMCTLLFFSLAKTKVVIRNMALGMLTNILVGYFLSRTVSYEYSAFGLFSGSLVYLILMLFSTRKLLLNLDYQYYSAF